MKKLITANLICLLLVLAACSSIKHQPSQTAIPATAIPSLALTQVPLLATETPHPEGQPASQWKGIPIMPGATSGEGDEEGYVFTVKATPQQVQDYYQMELGKLGWQLSSRSEDGSSLVLLFMNSASSILTVSVLAKQDKVLVLLSE